MVIDYNEIVGFLEEFAHDVDQEDVSRVYAVLSFVSELASQHGEVSAKYFVLHKDYDHLLNAFEAIRQREAKVIENYKMVVAGKDGKYAALHDYCAVVEAERNELRQRNGVQSNSIGILQNKVAELEVEFNKLAKAYAKVVVERFLGK